MTKRVDKIIFDNNKKCSICIDKNFCNQFFENKGSKTQKDFGRTGSAAHHRLQLWPEIHIQRRD